MSDLPDYVKKTMQAATGTDIWSVLSGARDPEDWQIEAKLDGFRLVAYRNDKGVELFTRSGKRQDGKLPYLEEALMDMERGTCIDGELVAYPTEGKASSKDFAYVQSVMLSLPERAAHLVKSRRLTYVVFDITAKAGVDISDHSLRQRLDVLHKVVRSIDHSNVAQSYAFPSHAITYESQANAIWQSYLDEGFEGVVMKNLSSTYNGTRDDWVKIKDQPTIDAIIVGYKPGAGKYHDTIGSIRFGQPDENGNIVERGAASGMSDEERYDIGSRQAELLGTVVEISHMGIYPDGISTRHPQFVRLRDDKPTSEVFWHDR